MEIIRPAFGSPLSDEDLDYIRGLPGTMVSEQNHRWLATIDAAESKLTQAIAERDALRNALHDEAVFILEDLVTNCCNICEAEWHIDDECSGHKPTCILAAQEQT